MSNLKRTIMKKRLVFVVTSLCLFLASCNNDDKDEVILITSQELIQTTWDVECIRYNENNEVEHKESCIMQFLTDTTGLYVEGYGSGDAPILDNFHYHVDKRIITFENSILVGIWTLIDKSPKQLILQAYLPQKYKAVLTKKY